MNFSPRGEAADGFNGAAALDNFGQSSRRGQIEDIAGGGRKQLFCVILFRFIYTLMTKEELSLFILFLNAFYLVANTLL